MSLLLSYLIVAWRLLCFRILLLRIGTLPSTTQLNWIFSLAGLNSLLSFSLSFFLPPFPRAWSRFFGRRLRRAHFGQGWGGHTALFGKLAGSDRERGHQRAGGRTGVIFRPPASSYNVCLYQCVLTGSRSGVFRTLTVLTRSSLSLSPSRLRRAKLPLFFLYLSLSLAFCKKWENSRSRQERIHCGHAFWQHLWCCLMCWTPSNHYYC